MFKLATTAAAFAALAMAAPASAAVLTSVPGSASYAGPFTYDFNNGLRPAAFTGGSFVNNTTADTHAQPYGSTGYYWSVGPTDGTLMGSDYAGVFSLAAYSAVSSISFLWGSVDSYNFVDLLLGDGSVYQTFNGSSLLPANGDRTSPATNPYVTISLSGTEQTLIRGVRFRSNTNAFETDNFRVNAVPEPATWALMLLGFGAVGFSMRRGRRASPRLTALA